MKKWLKRLKKDERGLTLVELLAVVVILAIVAAIAFISIGNVIENSKKDAHIANAQQVISAAKLYEASGGDVSAATNIKDDLDTIGELVDPWTKEEYTTLESATVTKATEAGADEEANSVGEFSITFAASDSNCSLTGASETELRTEGRDLCD